MTRLSISLFGHFQVNLDQKPVTGFEANKVRALLAYLAVEVKNAHSREKLSGMLWPDIPDGSAYANLRFALSNLRKAIGDHNVQPPFLLITSDALQFNQNSNFELDVHMFTEKIDSPSIEQMQHAVSHYRGEFLEGFAIEDSATFEEWIVVNREQLQRKMLKLLRCLTDHFEELGDYGQALNYAWQFVELEPWIEEGQQKLMRLLALNGQRSEALAQYGACRRLLFNELGVEPSNETSTLYQEIRSGLVRFQPPHVSPPAFLSSQSPSIEVERSVFVARDTELEYLDNLLNKVLSRHGQPIFITGEPGSGKSMLVQEFTRRNLIANPDLIVVNGNCNAHTGFGDPYLPFLEILQMLTGDVEARWASGAITRGHAQRLWGLLPNAVQALVEDGPELIDLFVPGNALLARVKIGAALQATRLDDLLKRKAQIHGSPNIQQTDLFEQYTRVLQKLAHKHPIVLILDDLQWADCGSISLLFHLGRVLAGHQILLVGVYRPADVAMGRSGERHPLEPVINEFQRQYGDVKVDLSQVEGRHFVEAYLENEASRLGKEFQQALYQHTGGHPLFVAELLHGLQERGDLIKDENGQWIEGQVLNWEILPPRVEAVIAESIARLPEPLQLTLTIASVEGEEFIAQGVSRVQAVEDQEIVRQLSGPLSKLHRLVIATGFVRSGEQQISSYRFRHFLFQKYLYNRIDKVERAHLHESMGKALEAIYGDQTHVIASQLARHYEIAGMITKAVTYLYSAGDQAIRLYANAEAISHYRRALNLLQTLETTPERDISELRLRIALGVPLLATRGFSDSELEQNYGRARELTRRVETTSELFQVLSGLKNYYDLRLSLHTARELADDMLEIAKHLKDQMLLQFAYHQMSTTALYLGRLNAFLEYRQKANEIYDRNTFRAIIFQLGFDPESAGLSHAGWAYWLLGYPEQAKQKSQEALAWSKELGHPFMIAFATFFAAQLYCYLREATMARLYAEETIALSRELGMAFWLAAGNSVIGWILAEEGQIEKALYQQQDALATLSKIGAELGRIQHVPLLAETYIKTGLAAEGLALVDEALSIASSADFQIAVSDLYRCKGELFLIVGNSQTEAETCFQQSIIAARQIASKSWELRATICLCRLWQQQNKIAEAYNLLSLIYCWFTEGFNTQDMIEAHQLIDELADRMNEGLKNST